VTGITTHVLDTAAGRPAAGVAVALHRDDVVVTEGVTDADGRWQAAPDAAPGVYRLVFGTGAYFSGAGFHPQVTVEFLVTDDAEHHHVPLLLSPFGYTTYRGS
jgi:5-hydroxyisourate hydrolase